MKDRLQHLWCPLSVNANLDQDMLRIGPGRYAVQLKGLNHIRRDNTLRRIIRDWFVFVLPSHPDWSNTGFHKEKLVFPIFSSRRSCRNTIGIGSLSFIDGEPITPFTKLIEETKEIKRGFMTKSSSLNLETRYLQRDKGFIWEILILKYSQTERNSLEKGSWRFENSNHSV